MKSQSMIIQFILFFVIGLSLFLSIGNFFRLQHDTFREDVADLHRELINSYFSSLIITSVDSCKQCDFVKNDISLERMTAGYFVDVSLDSSGLTVSTQPEARSFSSSAHNFNSSLNFISSSAPSVRPISLVRDGTDLTVGQS